MSCNFLRIRPLLASLVFVIGTESSVLAQDTVTTCGQTLDHSATLANDIDCTGMTTAVTIRHNATLTLAGHSITGAPILCDRNCVIQGPGTIAGLGGGSAVVRSATSNGSVAVTNELTLVGSTVFGSASGLERTFIEGSTVDGGGTNPVGVQARRLTMTGSTVTNHVQAGVYGSGRISNSTISDNGWNGVLCGKIVIEGSEITGNGFAADPSGIFSSFAVDCYTKAKVEGTQIAGNYNGVNAVHLANAGKWVGRIQLTNSLVDSNERNGVASTRVSISDSQVTNNGCLGASTSRRLRFESTEITGNGTNVSCSVRADVFSYNTPILGEGAVCQTSLGNGASYDESWGVCTLD